MRIFQSLEASLHRGRGPQLGEVTRPAVVEKEPAFTTTPGFRGEDSRVCYRTYN